MKNKVLTTIFAVALAVLVLTISIGLPIYVRPFYYIQIDEIASSPYIDYTRDEIKDAYNQLLDYLTIPGKEFGVGAFEYSEEGKSHFEDCRALFSLNAICLISSLVIIVVLKILEKKNKFKMLRPYGMDITFTSGLYLIVTILALVAIVSLDFRSAFTAFHKIFFPGKTNWLFNPHTDPIIWALPNVFFVRCAVLIAVSVIVLTSLMIIISIIKRNKIKK
ncbi:MAG: TIGR01906 family membrane protein [Clostridia bacterium]|nr:TIGR01906 family membrane protein [Clostridia bacterium]